LRVARVFGDDGFMWGRHLCWTLWIAACAGRAPPARLPSAGAITPAGWVEVAPDAPSCPGLPVEVRLREDGAVAFAAASPEEPTGRGVALHVSGADGGRGRLDGLDQGIWGGKLEWWPPGGGGPQIVADDNVRGIVSVSGDTALALEGHASSSYSVGGARWVRVVGREAQSVRYVPLDGAVLAFAEAADGVWALTTEGITWIGHPGVVTRLHPLPTSAPASLVLDGAGHLWVGTAGRVVHLIPRDDGGFEEQWLAPERCP
jgi:hypothetical protein